MSESRLLRLWHELPEAVDEQDERPYRTLFIAGLVGATFHACFVAIFWAIQSPRMAVINVASLSIFVLAWLMNRRGRYFSAMTIIIMEVLGHQVLAVMHLGWDAGFQYYVVALPAVLFFLPPGRMGFKVGLNVLIAGTFLALVTLGRMTSPSHPVAPSILSVLESVNILAVFGLVGLFSGIFAETAHRAEARMSEALAKAEHLLHNILPVPIAARLKDDDSVIADGFDEASVLFADMVGFTTLSQQVSPTELVRLLNDIVSELDELTGRLGLEKIKTIGDCYMVAAGIPLPRPDHASAVAEFGLQMMNVIVAYNEEHGTDLQFRVGINSGPVVAGIIGTRKFIYDLWGDTVNTASRMESHGLSGEVQITAATRNLLGDSYILEPRGPLEIKGKGAMETWLIKGRRES